jgi:ribose 5-phosphate isomerase B
MRVALASDHAGFSLKGKIYRFLSSQGYEVMDLGPEREDPVDYPDYAAQVALMVSKGEVERGILVCGTGLGMMVVANKFKGVRAVSVSDEYSARQSRKHLDANVLCLGARVLGEELALSLVEVWLSTDFEGGRHLRRLEKLRLIEEENLK